MPDPQLVLKAPAAPWSHQCRHGGGLTLRSHGERHVGDSASPARTSLDSVMLITLAPGGYSAVATSVKRRDRHLPDRSVRSAVTLLPDQAENSLIE